MAVPVHINLFSPPPRAVGPRAVGKSLPCASAEDREHAPSEQLCGHWVKCPPWDCQADPRAGKWGFDKPGLGGALLSGKEKREGNPPGTRERRQGRAHKADVTIPDLHVGGFFHSLFSYPTCPGDRVVDVSTPQRAKIWDGPSCCSVSICEQQCLTGMAWAKIFHAQCLPRPDYFWKGLLEEMA